VPARIAICDDDLRDVERLRQAIQAYDGALETMVFSSGENLLEAFMGEGVSVDLLFLDIYMPGLNGIDTARKLMESHRDMKIVFTTSSGEHYPQAYGVFAFNYLEKPLSRARLHQVLDRALEAINDGGGKRFQIKYKGIFYTVRVSDVQYIESRDKLVLFHQKGGRVLRCYGKLDTLLREIPGDCFLRSHQSFAVNINYITELGDHYFRVGEVAIAISKKYLKSAKEAYYDRLFSRMGEGVEKWQP
jgi:DNA-binding LytR/AlgR family response regulator